MHLETDPNTAPNTTGDALPEFDDAPGTHGELISLPIQARDQLRDHARDILAHLEAEAA